MRQNTKREATRRQYLLALLDGTLIAAVHLLIAWAVLAWM